MIKESQFVVECEEKKRSEHFWTHLLFF